MEKPEEPDLNENNAKVITSEPKSTQDPKLAKKLSKDEKKAEKQKAKEEVTKKRQEQANLDYADFTTFGNLGSTMIKRAYLTVEILASFYAVGNLLSKYDRRNGIVKDQIKLKWIIGLLLTHSFSHFALIFVLAFKNKAIHKKKKHIARWRPFLNLVLFIGPSFVLLQRNKLFYTFSRANKCIWGLGLLYFQQFFYNSIPYLLIKDYYAVFIKDSYKKRAKLKDEKPDDLSWVPDKIENIDLGSAFIDGTKYVSDLAQGKKGFVEVMFDGIRASVGAATLATEIVVDTATLATEAATDGMKDIGILDDPEKLKEENIIEAKMK